MATKTPQEYSEGKAAEMFRQLSQGGRSKKDALFISSQLFEVPESRIRELI